MSAAFSTNGNKCVILVNGVPASGKSTVARHIAERFGFPYLTIDGIKEPFMELFAPVDRQLNRDIGRAAYQTIWSIVAHAPANCVYVIDAWFGFQPRSELQRYLQQAGIAHVVEIWNQISGDLAAERYASRLHQRADGHPGAEYVPELRQLAERATPMALGPVLTLDQSQPLCLPHIERWLQTHHLQPVHAHSERRSVAALGVRD